MMDIILNNSGIILIGFVLSVGIILGLAGAYANKVEKRLQAIEDLALRIEILMTAISGRVEKIEDKISTLSERVGYLEGFWAQRDISKESASV
jgi:hypothetical protein